MYDSAFVALKKTGLDIDLVIGEVGWPMKGVLMLLQKINVNHYMSYH